MLNILKLKEKLFDRIVVEKCRGGQHLMSNISTLHATQASQSAETGELQYLVAKLFSIKPFKYEVKIQMKKEMQESSQSVVKILRYH